jgi:hypothetical protein
MAIPGDNTWLRVAPGSNDHPLLFQTNPEFLTHAKCTVGENTDRYQIAQLDFANLLVGGNLHFSPGVFPLHWRKHPGLNPVRCSILSGSYRVHAWLIPG